MKMNYKRFFNKYRYFIARWTFAISAVVMNMVYFFTGLRTQYLAIGIPMVLLVVCLWQHKKVNFFLHRVNHHRFGKLSMVVLPALLLMLAFFIRNNGVGHYSGLGFMFALHLSLRLPYMSDLDLEDIYLVNIVHTVITLVMAAAANVNPVDFIFLIAFALCSMSTLPDRYFRELLPSERRKKCGMASVALILVLVFVFWRSNYMLHEVVTFFTQFSIQRESILPTYVTAITVSLGTIFLISGWYLSCDPDRPRAGQAMMVLTMRICFTILHALGFVCDLFGFFPMSYSNIYFNLISMALMMCVIAPERPILFNTDVYDYHDMVEVTDMVVDWGLTDEFIMDLLENFEVEDKKSCKENNE